MSADAKGMKIDLHYGDGALHPGDTYLERVLMEKEATRIIAIPQEIWKDLLEYNSPTLFPYTIGSKHLFCTRRERGSVEILRRMMELDHYSEADMKCLLAVAKEISSRTESNNAKWNRWDIINFCNAYLKEKEYDREDRLEEKLYQIRRERKEALLKAKSEMELRQDKSIHQAQQRQKKLDRKKLEKLTKALEKEFRE